MAPCFLPQRLFRASFFEAPFGFGGFCLPQPFWTYYIRSILKPVIIMVHVKRKNRCFSPLNVAVKVKSGGSPNMAWRSGTDTEIATPTALSKSCKKLLRSLWKVNFKKNENSFCFIYILYESCWFLVRKMVKSMCRKGQLLKGQERNKTTFPKITKDKKRTIS